MNNLKKRFMFVLILCIVFVVVIFVWFVGRQPKWSWRAELVMRSCSLKQWHDLLSVKSSSTVPDDLYELSMEIANLPKSSIDFYFPVHLQWRLSEDYKNQLKDPNAFNQLVPYRLYKSVDGWIIKEKEECIDLYPQLLMIDQDGIIYEVKKKGNKNDRGQ